MEDRELEMLLLQAKEEIISLRSQNHSMRLRLDMFDNMMLLFNTQPAYHGMTMGEDIARKIERHLENKKKQPIE